MGDGNYYSHALKQQLPVRNTGAENKEKHEQDTSSNDNDARDERVG